MRRTGEIPRIPHVQNRMGSLTPLHVPLGAPLPPVCVLRSPSRDGAVNLALEEWLLARTQPGNRRLLIYRNAPCVVIGRNQNPWRECDLSALREMGAPVLRRLTGGGAVWHDEGNVNYSFIAARDSYCVERQFALVSRALERLGTSVTRTRQNALLAGGLKISGNAFCLKKAGAIHHGTLLVESDLARLEQALAVPDVGGLHDKSVRSVRARVGNLSDICPRAGVDETIEALIAAFAEEAAASETPLIDLQLSGAPDSLDQLAARYASWEWRFGQSPPFTVQSAVGEGSVTVSVEQARVADLTCSFPPPASQYDQLADLKSFIAGRRFERDDLREGIGVWEAARRPAPALAALIRDWERGLPV